MTEDISDKTHPNPLRRICPQCGLPVDHPGITRCPRCLAELECINPCDACPVWNHCRIKTGSDYPPKKKQ